MRRDDRTPGHETGHETDLSEWKSSDDNDLAGTDSKKRDENERPIWSSKKPLVFCVTFTYSAPTAVESCGKAGLFLSAFPMFVPSLSWQNDHFYTKMAQKDRFLTCEVSASDTVAVRP
jgi:hypothetical protein